MRNALLAVVLLFGLVVVAGCEGNTQESSASSTGSTSVTTLSQSQQQVAPAPPPPAPSRTTTTQPLPSGWSYIRQTDLNAAPPATTPAE